MRKLSMVVATVIALALPLAQQNPSAAQQQPGPVEKFKARPNGVPGRYIVRFTEAAAGRRGWRSFSRPLTETFVRAYGINKVNDVYTHALNGFSADMTEAVARRISQDPRVFSVAQVSRGRLTSTQPNAPWGLDRLDGDTGRDGSYSYENDGDGVTVYVIDSGIRVSHNDFDGRASLGPAFEGSTSADCHGHGTHVAGIIGGITHGVAKAVDIVALRITDCSGDFDAGDVVSAINWVAEYHNSPAVVNLSFTVGEVDNDVDAAVENLISAGVTVVIAAGNGNEYGQPYDVSGVSPQRVTNAIIVAATGYAAFSYDYRWSSSNYGSGVDLYAPGKDITSAWINNDSDTEVKPGTSQAAPHVAGIAARYLGLFPNASHTDVHDVIVSNATQNEIHDNWPDTPNLLANSQFLDEDPPPPPAECVDGECLFADEGLYPGWNLESLNGQYVLSYQGDGNLVLYLTGSSWTPVWASNTQGTDAGIALMQADGNFVVYDEYWVPHWATDTVGNNGAYLKLHNNGNLFIYAADGSPLWSRFWY